MKIKNIISKENVLKVDDLIKRSNKIAITCHMTPDGDALGSSLGLMHTLKELGKNVYVVTPDTPPHSLDFLPGVGEIVIASRYMEKSRGILNSSDLIFCLDYNALSRIDRLASLLSNALATKVMIDHHPYPEDFTDVVISKPEMSSTCELLYHVLTECDLSRFITKEAAECIFTGMLTDTGNFSYNSNNPDIYLIIAELINKGLNKDDIYEKAWNTNSANRLRICGYALYEKMQLFEQYKLSLIILTNEELKRFSYIKGDTEGLVNKPLSIPGIIWSVFIRADEDDYVKISMRSKGNFAVNEICEKLYGGGGHLNAAGGEYRGTLANAVNIFMDYLDKSNQFV